VRRWRSKRLHPHQPHLEVVALALGLIHRAGRHAVVDAQVELRDRGGPRRNRALARSREVAAAEMGKVTGGMLPPGIL